MTLEPNEIEDSCGKTANVSSNFKSTYEILIESDQTRFSVVVEYQYCFNHGCSVDVSNKM